MIAAEVVAPYHADVISPNQMRAGRALLGWKQTDLAAASGLALIVVKNIERGATDPRVSTISRIQAAFDQAGLVFLDDGDVRDGGPGLRLKRHLP